ncbi:hypothetical protein EWB00_011181 [Schistosoma japonicum]|uniref:Saposin B-type domain-containing protein n=1 Tax=Schistosoma japonicum TaxID=6182 RepID=A0A4Z2DLQ6_SCHJA|nr:hypothetical protein EWB00_011181 [Schistosoma japonicum]
MKSLSSLCVIFLSVLYVNSMTVDSVQQLQRHKPHGKGSPLKVFQCISCKGGTNQVLNIILSSSTNVSISNMIQNLCMKTGPFNTSCKMLANELASKTISLFRQLVPQQWCAFLGFCWYPPAVPVCRYCLNTGLQIKSMLLSEPFLSELYNNTLTMCDIVPTFSVICGSFLHDIFMAITLSFNKEFLIQRLCQHGGLC